MEPNNHSIWCEKSATYFDLKNPRPGDVHIEDIAAALSKLCRYTGHVNQFYSVAQHSVYVAEYAANHMPRLRNFGTLLPLYALLHDAAEAYVGDVVTPLKNLIPNYGAIEHRVHQAILRRFGLNVSPALEERFAELVKYADLWVLAQEKASLLPNCTHDWSCTKDIPVSRTIKPWSPKYAERTFLRTFYALGGK